MAGGWNNLGSGCTTAGNGFTVIAPGSGSSWLTSTASSVQSGKRYWEFIPSYVAGANTQSMFGVAHSGVGLASYIGATTDGVGNNNQGAGNNMWYNAGQFDRTDTQSWISTNGPPNFLGCAVDTAASRLFFFWPQNNLWYGTFGSFNSNIASVTGIDISGLIGGGASLVPGWSCQSTTITGASLGDFPPLIASGVPSGYSMWNTGLSSYTAGINFINPSEISSNLTLAQSNLRVWANAGLSSNQQVGVGNLPIPTNSRAYWECRIDAVNGETAIGQFGVRRTGQTLSNTAIETGSNVGIGYYPGGAVKDNGTTLATITSWQYTGDVVQIATDTRAAVQKIWFGVNGTFDGDPAAGTGGYSLSSILGAGAIYPAIGCCFTGMAAGMNFGGYSNLYTIPTGFVMLDDAVSAGDNFRARIMMA